MNSPKLDSFLWNKNKDFKVSVLMFQMENDPLGIF
jgi:hypothetical protein